MTTQEARELLGKEGENLSDDEIETIISELSPLADVFLDSVLLHYDKLPRKVRKHE